jgi:hypothetical protein
MMRFVFPSAAFLSLFIFPPLVSFLFIALAGFLSPLSAVALGLFADILYYPGSGLPVGLISGIILAAACFFVRAFVKARIMV